MKKTKKCSTCKKFKFVEEFSRDASRSDGLEHRCKDCENRRMRRYREENREADLERKRRYNKENRHVERVREARKRAVKRNAPTDGHTMAELSESWNERDFYGCYWCGADLADGFHVDHVIPLSKGGPHTVHNLVPACPDCNLSKGNKLPIIEWTPPT